MRRSRAYGSPRHLLLRVILTIGLIAPAAFIYIELRQSIDDRQATASRELLGVEYLRVLEPLAAALGTAQSAAVGGGPLVLHESNPALQGRVNAVAEVDTRIGAALGVSERWVNLRKAIEALPTRAEPRVYYAAYHDIMELELALVIRVADLSGLSVDADADSYYLHQAVTRDLPGLTVSTSRLADLGGINQLGTLSVADLALLQELREDARASASHLVDSIETAASASTDQAMVSNIFAPLDAVRGDLDKLTAAGTSLIDANLSGVDAAVMTTLRENLAKAASALSTRIFDQLTTLLTGRRDAAARDGLYAGLALALIVVLGLIPTAVGTRDLLRARRELRAQERLDEPEPIGPGPQWTREPAAGGRERVGAAR